MIEQFDPAQIVILNRDESGALTTSRSTSGGEAEDLPTERRQFAEAIWSRWCWSWRARPSVAFPVASSIMEPVAGRLLHAFRSCRRQRI
jgi:putative ATP-dependent endonuclease of OLD family